VFFSSAAGAVILDVDDVPADLLVEITVNSESGLGVCIADSSAGESVSGTIGVFSLGDLQFGVADKGGLDWVDPNSEPPPKFVDESPENILNPDVYSC